MVRYLAEHVLFRKMLLSKSLFQDETLLAAELMEDMRKQVGVAYPQDEE